MRLLPVVALAIGIGALPVFAGGEEELGSLGRQIFFDTNLSKPPDRLTSRATTQMPDSHTRTATCPSPVACSPID